MLVGRISHKIWRALRTPSLHKIITRGFLDFRGEVVQREFTARTDPQVIKPRGQSVRLDMMAAREFSCFKMIARAAGLSRRLEARNARSNEPISPRGQFINELPGIAQQNIGPSGR